MSCRRRTYNGGDDMDKLLSIFEHKPGTYINSDSYDEYTYIRYVYSYDGLQFYAGAQSDYTLGILEANLGWTLIGSNYNDAGEHLYCKTTKNKLCQSSSTIYWNGDGGSSNIAQYPEFYQSSYSSTVLMRRPYTTDESNTRYDIIYNTGKAKYYGKNDNYFHGVPIYDDYGYVINASKSDITKYEILSKLGDYLHSGYSYSSISDTELILNNNMFNGNSIKCKYNSEYQEIATFNDNYLLCSLGSSGNILSYERNSSNSGEYDTPIKAIKSEYIGNLKNIYNTNDIVLYVSVMGENPIYTIYSADNNLFKLAQVTTTRYSSEFYLINGYIYLDDFRYRWDPLTNDIERTVGLKSRIFIGFIPD